MYLQLTLKEASFLLSLRKIAKVRGSVRAPMCVETIHFMNETVASDKVNSAKQGLIPLTNIHSAELKNARGHFTRSESDLCCQSSMKNWFCHQLSNIEWCSTAEEKENWTRWSACFVKREGVAGRAGQQNDLLSAKSQTSVLQHTRGQSRSYNWTSVFGLLLQMTKNNISTFIPSVLLLMKEIRNTKEGFDHLCQAEKF